MKTKRCRIYVAAAISIFFSIFAAVFALAQEEDKAKILQEFRRRLEDSNGVSVYIDVIAKEKTEEQSITEELQKDIEEKLKESKIKLLTKDQLEYAPGRPRLALYLVIFKEPSLKDVYIYSFRLVHFEAAILERNDIYAEGVCWDSGLYVGREKIASIRKNIKTHVSRYINDYLAANPIQR
ncbi:MAG: hypothetical protein JW715_12180 [Sedimentisphaerales bacterium]|nr:hypothetical protein [Sedimentisphaerales bacterium]